MSVEVEYGLFEGKSGSIEPGQILILREGVVVELPNHPSEVSSFSDAETLVRDVRNAYQNDRLFRLNRKIAILKAREAMADIVYDMRPDNDDVESAEALQIREAMHLLVGASNKVLRGSFPRPERPQDIYFESMSKIVRSKSGTPIRLYPS